MKQITEPVNSLRVALFQTHCLWNVSRTLWLPGAVNQMTIFSGMTTLKQQLLYKINTMFVTSVFGKKQTSINCPIHFVLQTWLDG